MSRFFFDFHDRETIVDDDGLEMADRDMAIGEAAATLAAIAADLLRSDPSDREVTVTVRSDTGDVVYSATLTFRTNL